jgi:alkylation response protein AidB-like acyl-CoA dehydrogenase
MLAVLTPEQDMLADTVRSLGNAVGVRNPQDIESFDHQKAWATLANTGLVGLRTREDGAPLASAVDAMVVAHGLGALLSPTPFVSTTLATELLELAGAPRDLIDAIAGGSAQAGLLFDRRLTGLAPPGADAVVIGGARAEYGLALRPTADGVQVVRVELAGAFLASEGTDFTTSLRVPVPGAIPATSDLGKPLAADALHRWIALALTLVSADCAGAMRAALDGAIEYTKHRQAYGVPIGSFQALQHLAADAFTSCEAAVTTNNYAAWAVDAAEPHVALLAARTAKAWVSSVARDVTETVMQIYGGIGQTWEHIAHVYARRAMLDTALFGDEKHQLDQIFLLRKEEG